MPFAVVKNIILYGSTASQGGMSGIFGSIVWTKYG